MSLDLIEADGPAKGEWMQKYQPDGNSIPIVFIVRADGEQLYAKSGYPEGLANFLKEHLMKAGTYLSDADVVKLEEAVTSAKTAFQSDDVSTALRLLSAAPGRGSYARSAMEASQLVEEIMGKADKEIEQAAQLVSDQDRLFEGALLIAQASKKYSKLSQQRRKIGIVLRKYKGNEAASQALDQAEALVRAETREKGPNPESAVQSYQTVVSNYPGSEAARLASERLAALGADVPETPNGASVATSIAAPTTQGDRTWTSSNGQFTIRATLVDFDGTAVRIRKEDGSVITVPLAKLSEQDAQFVNGAKIN